MTYTRNVLFVVLALFVSGCAQNYYNVPRETYEKKVRVLGVAPIMLDADSDIRHPDKGAVLTVIHEANRKNEKELVEILKNNGEYFAVRFIDDEAGQIFTRIVSRRERRDDAGVVYNKYFYKPEEIRKYIQQNNVDAVMLVTVSGISMLEKIYSNTKLAFLEENYNNMIMTAQILDADGTVLWEYPNFRQRFLTYSTLFALQYPDFEEARANLTDQVKVKYKSVPGISRAFAKNEGSSVNSAKQVSTLYNKQFADMNSFLHYYHNPFADKKTAPGNDAAPLVSSSTSQAPAAVTSPAPTPPEPKAAAEKSVLREFEPVKPLDPGFEVIKELDVK
jgi:hypothetical protein